MKPDDFYIPPDPSLTDWAYINLRLPQDTWKPGGFEHLVASLEELESDRAERYARRIAHLEHRIYELENKLEGRTIAAVILGALSIDLVLRPWYKKILKLD